MDETTLRDRLDRATASEPPIGPLVRNALRAGIRLRRRRRLTSAGTCATAVAVLAGGVPAITGGIGSTAGTGHRPVKPTVYVLGGETVVPISLATDAPGKPIKLTGPRGIQGMAITRDGRTAYVANTRGELTPISTATNTAGRRFWVGLVGSDILITPNGKSAYVFEPARGVVAVDLVTHAKLKAFKLPYATTIAMTPNGKTVYVASAGGYRAGKVVTVTPIRTATNTALRPIKLTADSFWPSIVIAPDGRTAYVTDIHGPGQPTATVTPIDLATGTPLAPMKLPSSTTDSSDLVITPGSRSGYVTYADGVTPINLQTDTVQKLIKLPPTRSGVYSVAITPDGRTAYAWEARQATIYPISLSSNKPLKPIRLDHPSWWTRSIGFGPNGYAFVGREHDYRFLETGAITLIRTATDQVTKTIFLPNPPVSIVFAP